MRKVIDIRTDAMLTQKEFATAIGASVSCVQKWEQGLGDISLRYRRKIVDFCKTNKIKFE